MPLINKLMFHWPDIIEGKYYWLYWVLGNSIGFGVDLKWFAYGLYVEMQDKRVFILFNVESLYLCIQ